ncbi:MAG TPA: DUF4394 domain-containing protein, partial [Tepidisphaeraceae bacterium]|nr:DUF4394 domain-containing protein [Tepidisphaeraceae bacterium]
MAMVGVTGDNTLIGFDSSNPSLLTFGKPISGLAENEVVRGIDYRPTTGELFALGSFGNLYTLDATGFGSAPAAQWSSSMAVRSRRSGRRRSGPSTSSGSTSAPVPSKAA